MSECNWPFHHDYECERCRTWEERHGENLTRYLDERAAEKERQRVERDALRKITSLTETA